MSLFIKEEFIVANNYTFLYKVDSVATISKMIEKSMAERGYRHLDNDIYERGNGLLRLLFGVFYKHYKVEIRPESIEPTLVRVSIKTKSSGFAGGVLGMNQVQKELAALKVVLTAL